MDVLEIDFELAGLNLGQVENVADKAQQMPAGVLDLVEVAGEVLQALLLGDLLQHLAIADNGIEWGAQLVAHVGKEHRFGAIGRVGFHRRLLKLRLALLEFADVREHADSAAVWRAPLADARPDVTVSIFGKSLWIAVLRKALGDPLIRRSPVEIDHSTVDDCAQDGRERRPWHQHIVDFRIKLPKLVVAHHKTVLRIVQHKAVRDGLEGGRDHPTLALGLLGEPLALHDALAEQAQRVRHGAYLAAGSGRDRGLKVTGGDAIHRGNHVVQGTENRAKHDQSDCEAENYRRHHDQIGEIRCPR